MVQPQALRSVESSQGDPVVFLPTFPDNFPALVPPQPMDDQTLKETLAACHCLQDTASTQAAYMEFSEDWYAESMAKAKTTQVQSWISTYTSPTDHDQQEQRPAPVQPARLQISGTASSSHTAY